MEKTMLRGLLTMASIVAIGSLVSVGAQAASTGHNARSKQTHRHAVHQAGEITSFSSSSAPLNVGVNHPPKK
jgi:hypothetical protein